MADAVVGPVAGHPHLSPWREVRRLLAKDLSGHVLAAMRIPRACLPARPRSRSVGTETREQPVTGFQISSHHEITPLRGAPHRSVRF